MEWLIMHFIKCLFCPNKPKVENKNEKQSGKNSHGIKLLLSLKLEYEVSKTYSGLKITYKH